ncbi:MAG TPA: NifU family protein, partial [Bacteroidia bacterium]|nr:NifU family protein [Bacteroidia bacterium]
EGVVSVQMKGSCQGCPSSTMTLKAGIEGLLKRLMPEDVREVVSV